MESCSTITLIPLSDQQPSGTPDRQTEKQWAPKNTHTCLTFHTPWNIHTSSHPGAHCCSKALRGEPERHCAPSQSTSSGGRKETLTRKQRLSPTCRRRAVIHAVGSIRAGSTLTNAAGSTEKRGDSPIKSIHLFINPAIQIINNKEEQN